MFSKAVVTILLYTCAVKLSVFGIFAIRTRPNSFMTSPLCLTVFRIFFAAYRAFIAFVDFRFDCSPCMSTYPGGCFFLLLTREAIDVRFFPYIQVAFCTCNELNIFFSCSLYSVEYVILYILLNVGQTF